MERGNGRVGKSGGIYQRLSGGKLLLGGGFWNAIISDRPFSHRKIQFEKHIQRGIPPQDGAGKDRFFTSGGSKSTPALEEISTDWPSPWLFTRILALSLLICIGWRLMFEAFNNAPVVSGAAYLGLLFSISFAVPFSILVLFAEFNVRRNISWYSIIVLVLGGGILSLIVTMILNELSGNPRAAYWAGPIEEAAKLVVAIFFARKFFLNGQILNGMLCGAAVGAGFAGFETAGYIVNSEYTGPGPDPLDIAVMRGIFAPFGHVSWSAIMAGAFWLAMKKQRQNNIPSILQPSFGELPLSR